MPSPLVRVRQTAEAPTWIPGRAAEPMQVVAVRLTAEELAALDAIAERDHISRSEAIRRALADRGLVTRSSGG